MKRACKLALEGSSSAALSAMEGLGMAPPTQDTVDKLHELHPEDPDGLHPIPNQLQKQGKEWAKEVQIDGDDVLTAVASAPKRKSEDMNGWRVEFLMALLNFPDALAALVTIFRQICTGALPVQAAAAFRRGRLVAIQKPDPGGIRPIGIPLVWRRMAGRIFNAKHKDELKHTCVGLDGRVVQFAIGRASGPQAMSISLQELMERNLTWILASLDIKNAFNCMAEGVAAMAEGVAASPLYQSLSYYNMCYSTPAQMTYHAGGQAFTILSKTGSTQGTTDGMQHFSLGQHPLLVSAAKDFPDVIILEGRYQVKKRESIDT